VFLSLKPAFVFAKDILAFNNCPHTQEIAYFPFSRTLCDPFCNTSSCAKEAYLMKGSIMFAIFYSLITNFIGVEPYFLVNTAVLFGEIPIACILHGTFIGGTSARGKRHTTSQRGEVFC
jgi:hypothetical protein